MPKDTPFAHPTVPISALLIQMFRPLLRLKNWSWIGLLLLLCGCSAFWSEEGDEDWTEQEALSSIEEDREVSVAQPISSHSSQLDPWDLWTSDSALRGANVYQRRVYPELDGEEFMGNGPVGPPYSQEDFNLLADLGANYVHISHPGLFSEDPPYQQDLELVQNLDDLLRKIAEADLFAVIAFRTGPGRSEFTFHLEDVGDWFDEHHLNDQVWVEPEAQEAWVGMWQYTAERYREHPNVVGYDLMVEPNANEVWFDEWDPETFHQSYSGSLCDWNQLFPRITEGIRQIDELTPILVGPMGYSAIEWLPFLKPSGDPRTVYTVHQYAPYQYTHQWHTEIVHSFPDRFDMDWDGKQDEFDRSWLEALLTPLDRFQEEHQVPLAVTEFGVIRWIPEGADFLDSLMDLFEERGFSHALWMWEVSWEPYTEEVNAFNFRLGEDPQTTSGMPASDLLETIRSHWSDTLPRPSDFAEPTRAEGSLPEVKRWLYLIDVNLDQETVDRIASSTYDMVVLDFIPFESENQAYPMAEVVERLQGVEHPKLVVAYIDIGEAESYRTYWQSDWEVGDPAWIVGEDPDGWEENYPVAYWHEDWQDIWLGERGVLAQIMEDGFDGVYLDWVEAYSDENIVDRASEEDLDPIQEMIEWVADIRACIKSICGSCVVIGQNAVELVEFPAYRAAIDAVAQEQVWFDGGADNDPPGDCPLPRGRSDVETEDYRNSLSTRCKRQYDEFPESTLHMSSEEYLEMLFQAQVWGLPVFTVDYALDPENIAWVYEEARGLGFIPFVGSRALDEFIEPWP